MTSICHYDKTLSMYWSSADLPWHHAVATVFDPIAGRMQVH